KLSYRIFEIIRHLSDLFAACFVYPGQRGRAGPRLFAQFRPQDRSRSPKAHLHRARVRLEERGLRLQPRAH
ncbi:hypothetical protein VIGAN_07025400, partial [Vigna angularis var. angularis]